MKILELTRSFYPSLGGMEKFVADRLKIYDALGYDYQVITTKHSEKQLPNAKIEPEVIYLQNYTPYEIVPNLHKVMNNQQYDVLSINQTGYFYAIQASAAAKKQNKKIVLTPHYQFHTKRFNFVKKLHSKFLLPKLLQNVDKIIAFTKTEAEYWETKFPFTKDKLVIIPHYFAPPQKKNIEKKNRFGKFFLFLGRGGKNKRVDLLIKAFDKINSDYALVMTVAEDEINPQLKSIVEQNNKIRLLGRVSESEKQNLLATAIALIFPTDYEAFGVVNLEASFYSKPLLLSDLPIFKDILNEKGVIYFKNNLADILNAIKYFINLDENRKMEMGEINYLNLQNFTFEKIL